jgi:hypothetical protein
LAMARASSGLTPAWAWAAVNRKVGSRAIPDAKLLRVTVFMIVSFLSNYPLRDVAGSVSFFGCEPFLQISRRAAAKATFSSQIALRSEGLASVQVY